MQQQQQDDMMTKYKKNFNFIYSACLIHQRCLVVPLRRAFGVQALGTPCALAPHPDVRVGDLHAATTTCGLWIGIWFLCFLVRRAESVKLRQSGAKMHGRVRRAPVDAIRIGRTEKAAKLVVEPFLMVGLGGVLFSVYQQIHWSPYGLPYFFFAGGFTLPFVEIVKQQIWERRTQAMVDARVEQETLMREFRNRYGNSKGGERWRREGSGTRSGRCSTRKSPKARPKSGRRSIAERTPTCPTGPGSSPSKSRGRRQATRTCSGTPRAVRGRSRIRDWSVERRGQ